MRGKSSRGVGLLRMLVRGAGKKQEAKGGNSRDRVNLLVPMPVNMGVTMPEVHKGNPRQHKVSEKDFIKRLIGSNRNSLKVLNKDSRNGYNASSRSNRRTDSGQEILNIHLNGRKQANHHLDPTNMHLKCRLLTSHLDLTNSVIIIKVPVKESAINT